MRITATALILGTALGWAGAAMGQSDDTLRTVSWPNGDNFIGEFRAGLPNGQGTMRFATGETYTGLWENGCLVSGPARVAVFTSLATCRRDVEAASVPNSGTGRSARRPNRNLPLPDFLR